MERLAEAQAIAHLGSWEWDPVKDIISGSDEFYLLFGVSPDQMRTYQSFLDQLDPDDRAHVGRDVQESLTRKTPYDTEYRVRRPDGDSRYIHARGQLFVDEAGKPVRMVGTCLDITERKRAEAALRESEDKFKYVFDYSVSGKSITLPSGEMQVNKAFCEMLDYPPEELQSKRWQDITYPEDINMTQREIDALLTGEKEEARFTKRYLKKNGSVVWADVSTSLRRDGHGKPLYLMTSLLDITESVRAEEELRHVSLYARSLIEASLDPLVTISPEGEIMDVNKATEEATGVGRSKLIGSSFSDYFTEPEKAQAGYRKVLTDGLVIDYPLTLRHTSGKVMEVLYNATWYRNERGEVQGVFAAARDITERKRMEDEIRVLNSELEKRVVERTAQLEAANKELEAFSYTVSHDLRAPLRAIDGFSRILVEEHGSQLPEEARRYLGLVRSSTLQMGRLVDDLLAFSRLGRQPVSRQTVNPEELVRQAVEDLKSEREGRQIEMTMGSLPECQADPALLQQVWINLISNALKFTRRRERALIEISSRVENGETIFCIKDNGVGFDMQYAGKLFGVFQRFHRAEDYEGTGVGLAIVQRIVHRHGGRVWARAEADRGATFFFTLGGKDHD